MPHYRYLIIGGGMTADAVVNGIHEEDPRGSIGVISAEVDPPYDRPPLTKGLWKDKTVDQIMRKATPTEATLHLGVTATAIDPATKTVIAGDDRSFTYDRLLLATGGTPRRLDVHDDGVLYYRTLADYRRLRDAAEAGRHFVVIGGGFIGAEIAASLAMNGKRVTMVFPEPAINATRFPERLASFLNDYYRERGVEVWPHTGVTGVQRHDNVFEVRCSDGRIIDCDGVIGGLGIEPNTALASEAGLAVENGIVVDEHLRTSVPDIYAAGDVAAFTNEALGGRRRVEHEDNANTMGRIAGRNMTGAALPYDHIPYFYSDLFDLGYEAVGALNARLKMEEDWKTLGREGVVYYLDGDHLRGVLLWNVWVQVEAARALLRERRTWRGDELQGRLPAWNRA